MAAQTKPRLMGEKKAAQIKIGVVIVLALIMMLVAYFRFIHDGESTEEKAVPMAASIPQVDVAHVQMEIPRRVSKVETDGEEPLPILIRDIFGPARPLEKPESPFEAQEPKAVPSFELKGTIVSGAKSIAIINGKFVRTGDRVDGYEVVRIAKNEVALSLEGRQVVLEVLEKKGR